MPQGNWRRGRRRHLLVEIGTVETVIRQLLAKALKKERRNLKNPLLEHSELQLKWDISKFSALHCQPGCYPQCLWKNVSFFVLASCVSATTQVQYLPLHLMWPALPAGCGNLEQQQHRTELNQMKTKPSTFRTPFTPGCFTPDVSRLHRGMVEPHCIWTWQSHASVLSCFEF